MTGFGVLMYHRVARTDRPGYNPMNLDCPVERFQEHLDVLKGRCAVLALEEAWGLRGNGGGAVVLTFDDAWRENMETVVPVLQRYGFPATFFIPTGDLGLGPPYMTPEDVRSLPAAGIRVGNHTVNHLRLSALSEEGQWREIAGGQRVLSGLTGVPVRTLAYPFGLFNDLSVRVATKLGHTLACTVLEGFNDAETDPMWVRRFDASRLSGQELEALIRGGA